MERASRVMYSIANFFTWIIVITCIAGIVFSILNLTKVLPNEYFGAATLTYLIVVLLVSLITIALVRRAKDKHSSKGWDILFLVLGILGSNIFYILGGIFGIVALRR